jgi:DNA polymerase I-like protein with 3'-5' exonuclease and polymerase domains
MTLDPDPLDLLRAVLAEDAGLSPGRLSSRLADHPGPHYRDPFGWREILAAAARDGLITMEPGEPVALAAPVVPVSEFAAENAEKAPDGQDRVSPPDLGNPGIRELAQSEMFALDLNATALAQESGTLEERLAPVKRTRRTRAETEADRAAKAAEKEELKEQRAAERAALREQRAVERAQAKLDATAARIAEAEGGRVELPAVVFRDGLVRHASDIDAWAVIEMHLADIGLDCETSGYPLGHRLYELRTVQLGGEHAAVVLDAADPAQMMIARLALAMAGKVRAHSATADVIPVVAAGLAGWDEIWAKTHDSVLNAKLADPRLSGSDANALKELARDLLGDYAVSPAAEAAKNALFKAMGCLVDTTLTTPPERNGWHQVNRYSVTMTRYAGSDVLDLAAVLRALPPLPVDEAVLDREREFQAACALVTYTGFKLDAPYVKERIAAEEEARALAQRDVLVLSGGRIANPKSPDVIKLLPEIFPGVTLPLNRKTGNPSADKASLEKIARSEDETLRFLCRRILDYRHSDTTLGLLLKPFEELCEHGDGRMRPTVYTIEATTGRSSCRRPNAQQLSRQGGIRKCVIADPGYLGISADFEGCEIRVAAALSGDAGLYEAEVSGFCHYCQEDPCGCGKRHTGLHWRTAHSARKLAATKEDRYNAKRGSFTRLFGGGPETAADQVGCPVRDMEEMFEAFDANAPVFTDWDKWMRKCYKEGSRVWRDYATGENLSQSIDGSNRMVYQCYSGRNVYIRNGAHAAGNGAIQGTARELLVDGVLRWRKTRWGHYALLPILPIHDQILGWVPAAEASEASAELARCMETTVLSSPGFEVRIGAEVDEPFAFWPDSS